MAKIDIPMTEARLEKMYLTVNNKGEVNYVSIDCSLLAPNGKKVGTYEFQSLAHTDNNLPEELADLIYQFTIRFNELIGDPITSDLKLIEAPSESNDT